MFQKQYRIGRSRTGLGLFATEQIRKGKFIAEYKGRRLTTAQAEKLENNSSNRYLFEVNSRWTIDGSNRKNDARYGNHSCRPNAEAVDWRGGIAIRAKRKIEPGEEIVYNYGKDYLESFIPKCLCPKCLEKRREERRANAARRKRAAARASSVQRKRKTKTKAKSTVKTRVKPKARSKAQAAPGSKSRARSKRKSRSGRR
jgi:SET domain-containing protein